MMIEKFKKRGVSPVIATVFLVALVIAIAVIVFLLLKQFIGEACTKFDGQNVEVLCKNKVSMGVSYSGGQLSVENNGKTPIYELKVEKINEGGGSNIKEITRKNSDWEKSGLNEGESTKISFSGMGNVKKIRVIPFLLSKCGGDRAKKACSASSSIHEEKI